jgi:hypothetical protein
LKEDGNETQNKRFYEKKKRIKKREKKRDKREGEEDGGERPGRTKKSKSKKILF